MQNNNVYSVSQVNKYIAGMFADDLMLRRVSVKGEVGTVTYSQRGHIYFTVKDNDSQLAATMWASRRGGLDFKLETGMQVVVTGTVEVYERDGKYQIISDKITLDGQGNIYEEFEALKKKLEAQGMFDIEYKRPIPKYVKTLGVVTAATGAAVRDIIDISKRRNPGIQVVLFPSLVQGKEAPMSIMAGIDALEAYGVDVIIVGRGGGSMEDLWCFNDEMLAHKIFNCSVPVISAVGHETDFTIADFVSDLRAPTPSAAAELAVMDIRTELKRIEDYRRRLGVLIKNEIALYRKQSLSSREKLRRLSPESLINEKRNRLVSYEEKLNNRMERILTGYKNSLLLKAGRLHGLSPLNKLGGGYVYATVHGKSLKSTEDVKTGDEITVNLTDGHLTARVGEIVNERREEI